MFSNYSIFFSVKQYNKTVISRYKYESDEYKKEPNDTTSFEFKLNYINTASSKQIANILSILQDVRDKTALKVRWHYHKDDEDMYDEGLALNNNLKIEFEFIETD